MTTETIARPVRARPAPITLTASAEARIADLMAKAPGPVAGVRLSTPKRGCSGLAYSIDYVETAKPGDEAIATPAGTLFVDGASLLYLIGSVMDWVTRLIAVTITWSVISKWPSTPAAPPIRQ